jgi:energy-coupling factor transporter ATP-binding protein EcfA2
MKSKDVSLAVNPGEVHAIIGENGAGKSTPMKLLAGHLQPTRGELRIDGETVTLTGPVDAERRGHRPGSPGNPSCARSHGRPECVSRPGAAQGHGRRRSAMNEGGKRRGENVR